MYSLLLPVIIPYIVEQHTTLYSLLQVYRDNKYTENVCSLYANAYCAILYQEPEPPQTLVSMGDSGTNSLLIDAKEQLWHPLL
jgi:hypothetical protein